MSGRERSPATTLFFEAQLLGMDELPHRTIVDPQATLTELDNQAAQREVSFSDPLRKPSRMLAGNCSGLVTAHLPEATLPVSSTRRIQPIAVLIATPNRLAA